MNTGYLSIVTHADHPGMLRLLVDSHEPLLPESRDACPEPIRYTARFNDVEAALMHAHTLLRHQLVDIDSHLYRVPLERAIAVVDSLDLSPRRIYLDPTLNAGQLEQITHFRECLIARRRRRNRFIEVIGYLALLYLSLQEIGKLFSS